MRYGLCPLIGCHVAWIYSMLFLLFDSTFSFLVEISCPSAFDAFSSFYIFPSWLYSTFKGRFSFLLPFPQEGAISGKVFLCSFVKLDESVFRKIVCLSIRALAVSAPQCMHRMDAS